MPISPCNTLNVKTIRISQLASVSSTDLTDDDVIYISQYDSPNNVYYSKRTTLSDLTDYFNTRGNLTGSFSGSFKGSLLATSAITSSLTPSGAGTSLPAGVKYIPINVGGTVYKLPLYN